jgi:predicted nucleotidyltransferase
MLEEIKKIIIDSKESLRGIEGIGVFGSLTRGDF